MKQKIGILGSTGSIGSNLLEIIDKKKTKVIFLVAGKNFRKILSQAKIFNAKYIIITDYQSFIKAQKINKNKYLKIFNNIYDLNKLIKKKLDYVMASITGIDGLEPTFNIIKYTKKIAIANKESLICAWPIISKELKRNNTEFVPVDSEHFSIWSEIKNINKKMIRYIYLTASGGPLLNYDIGKSKKLNMRKILKHPTWQMGKKISIDSATLMNKCYEVMEAKNIFSLKYEKIKMIIHPDSYVHAIIAYKNGISKLVLHDTTMKIPIFNTIYSDNEIYRDIKHLNINKLNNLNLHDVKSIKYPMINLFKYLPNKHSLFETVIVSINDTIVNMYLNNKIEFWDISKLVLKFISSKEYSVYKKVYPRKISDIINLNRIINEKLQKSII
jgi:1-deoxy-D-xylulose-5-phosphate reductoisomerase